MAVIRYHGVGYYRRDVQFSHVYPRSICWKPIMSVCGEEGISTIMYVRVYVRTSIVVCLHVYVCTYVCVAVNAWTLWRHMQ